jgi:hypothetical protein
MKVGPIPVMPYDCAVLLDCPALRREEPLKLLEGIAWGMLG